MTLDNMTECENTFASLAHPDFDGERDCPVMWSASLMDSVYAASCGKDTLCGEGSLQIRAILAAVSAGNGRDDDTELLRELLEIIRENANCDTARTAAEKILSLMDAYGEQWDGHIFGKRCAALVCAALVTVYIAPESCTGCGKCRELCPKGAIAGAEGMIHVVDKKVCDRCYLCIDACPDAAARRSSGTIIRAPDAPVPVGGFAAAGAGLRRKKRRPPTDIA